MHNSADVLVRQKAQPPKILNCFIIKLNSTDSYPIDKTRKSIGAWSWGLTLFVVHHHVVISMASYLDVQALDSSNVSPDKSCIRKPLTEDAQNHIEKANINFIVGLQ